MKFLFGYAAIQDKVPFGQIRVVFIRPNLGETTAYQALVSEFNQGALNAIAIANVSASEISIYTGVPFNTIKMRASIVKKDLKETLEEALKQNRKLLEQFHNTKQLPSELHILTR